METPASEIVLVDDTDNELGVSTKLDAHRAPGSLHRALSAFLFNDRDELLLQRRASTKYHFAGLWSNSCCTHPRPGESVVSAGERRVFEELGLRCTLSPVGPFVYRAVDPQSNLVEHELDHVLIGHFDAEPHPAPDEVSEIAYLSLPDLHAALAAEPNSHTPWLTAALAVLANHHQHGPSNAPGAEA